MILKHTVKSKRKDILTLPIIDPTKIEGVMPANIVWKMKNVDIGIVGAYTFYIDCVRHVSQPTVFVIPNQTLGDSLVPKSK